MTDAFHIASSSGANLSGAHGPVHAARGLKGDREQPLRQGSLRWRPTAASVGWQAGVA